MSRCNQFTLGRIGSRPIMSKNIHRRWGVDHTGQFKYHPLASPALIVWKMMGQHLFLNIIPNNFKVGTGQKLWCDQGMSMHKRLPSQWVYSFLRAFNSQPLRVVDSLTPLLTVTLLTLIAPRTNMRHLPYLPPWEPTYFHIIMKYEYALAVTSHGYLLGPNMNVCTLLNNVESRLAI